MRRGPLLLPLAALAVHQLRYWLAYGPDAGHELLEQGHSYLHSLTPWLVLGMGVALGGFLSRAAHAWRSPRGAYRPGTPGSGPAGGKPARVFVRLWVAASAALLAIYTGQELLEGLFATGHPGGLAGVFGGGGVWAVPAALWIGGLVALALRGAELVLARLTRALPALRRALPPAPRPPRISLPSVAPLATAAAGRAPPRA